MSSKVRHPFKSFLMFVALCGGLWAAYEHRHLLEAEPQVMLTTEQRDAMRDQIVERYQSNEDFITVRAITWRPSEDRYRVDVEVDDRIADAKAFCRLVAAFVQETHDSAATVVAVDDAGRELARIVL